MMVKFKISKDGNEKKYIPLIRKMMNRSLSEIRECLCNNGYIDICGLEDIDRLQHMDKLIEELQKKGAEIILYEDDRVVETDFLKNIIEAHFDTERYLQETDDKVIEQD
ncbi:hypothetical protein QVN96_01855 [Mediterraneibacter glycyrrhizinilyticus]|uniref:hypothetical protein n=1 Tax=Mediterraneibacter glycyrrhizinilyticus TaxID=342942 RepID=UPI0025AAE7C0|nr:hypothetical protein [Mediterraneibacter glycyrrhizinilyticus]MDN0060164.1 hypothetical protein [Mediterraneibacter glycyrrhizinilyticus]